MPQTHDYRHHFRGLHGCPSVCRIRVYRGSAGATIIVATELEGENRGMSITNAAEVLATELERRHCPDPGARMLWVEHYPPREGAGRRPACRAHYALVSFARADDGTLHSPHWRHITSAGLAGLLDRLVDAERL